MTTSIAARKPRTRPAPSERDQQIYIDYQVTGRRQTDLAEQYKLTQCRVSQIIRRVDRWLADSSPHAPREDRHLAERDAYYGDHSVGRGSPDPAQLARRLERERLNTVCRESMRNFHQEQKTVTHKKGTRGDKPFDETTERTGPPNIQCLKVVLQANRQLTQLERKPPLEEAVETDMQPAQVETPLDPPDSSESISENSYPEVPQEDGWYCHEYDQKGRVVGYRRLDSTSDSSVCRSGAEPATPQPPTCPSPETATSSTSAATPDSSQTQTPPRLPIQNPKSKISPTNQL